MKRKNFLCALAALAALGASCSRTTIDRAPQAPETVQDDPYSVPVKWWAMEKQQPVMGPSGAKTSLRASFSEDSRAYLEVNGAGTEAAVLWAPGDRFKMLGYNAEAGIMYGADYTTEAGGRVAEFTTLKTVPSPCYSFCPTTRGWGEWNDAFIFSVYLPEVQTAVEGNIDPDVNLSYAYSESQDAPLHFTNLISLVRFRLSGSIADEITSVTLSGTSPLSGDLVMVGDGPTGYIYPGISFGGDKKYSNVRLDGDFRTGVDYYIATAPASAQTFTLTFVNDNGDTKTKEASKEISLLQGRISDLGTIDLGDSYDEEHPELTPILYMESSKEHPVTLTVIPDGYMADDLSVYETQAKSGLKALFGTEPFKTYKDYFNVWILKVASEGSGANITDGKGNVVTESGCYFGSGWGENSYGDMSANDDIVLNFVQQNCPDIQDGSHSIYEVPILILINDARYGGRCWSWSSGKSYAMVPVSAGNWNWNYPGTCAVSDEDPSLGIRDVTDAERDTLGRNSGDWRNTLVHEFGGHGFGRLGDEYWYDTDDPKISAISEHTWPVPMSLNISAAYDPTPWDEEVLSRREELMAQNPLYARIGVFQGGFVSRLNRWRSEKISCMIDNRFYFSAWQRMLIVKRILTLAGESFDADAFFALDHPEDPVRDAVASPVMGQQSKLPPIPVPPLAPVGIVMD